MKNDNHVWDNKHPTAQMLGRWQPWHAGHQKLFEEILKNVVDRDHQDSTRAISPLRKAEEAVEIDTTLFSVEEVFEQMMLVVKA